jgi:uncharacterized damage-inducible protein DinB
MNAESLAKNFGLNHGVIKMNTDGLTHEESLKIPEPGGNSLNWVLGHIIAERNTILGLLGEDPVWSESEAAPYERGTGPTLDAARPLDEILADLGRSQERLGKRLGELSDADLTREIDGATLGDRLSFLQFHETYHVGQTGILRRLAGKKGAIA